jgi:hypothetical protein
MAGALQFAGQAVSVPAAPGVEPKVVFGRMCEAFKIDTKVADFLVDTEGLETLEDFRSYIADPAEVTALIISKVKDVDKPGMNASRLRQAWLALGAAAQESANSKKRGAEDLDLDCLLPEAELNDIGQAFWSRCKLNFGVHVEPSDHLVSRNVKEIKRRQLQVHGVFKAKNLSSMLKAQRKRQHIGGGVEVILPEVEADTEVPASAASYLTMLFTLMPAYARAGCMPLASAPAEAETRDKDSTDYVEVPLDVVLRYHARAQNRAAACAGGDALAWLQSRDEEERQIWVEVHRASKKSLGKIIVEVMDKREAMWSLPIAYPPRQPREQVQQAPKAPATGSPVKAPQWALPGAGKFAPALKSGEQICATYNMGKCKEPCPRGFMHVCNAMLRNGRACGARGHVSSKCENSRRL